MSYNDFKDVYFIAEGADAHYGSVERAIKMCESAKSCGANAIKFQHHIPDEEMLPDIPQSSNMKEPLYDFLMRNALTINQHREIAHYCKEIGLEYLCTPFSWKAALELEEFISPRMYKIGSGEMTDLPTLRLIAGFKKPMIVSTGMSEVSEIQETYKELVDLVPNLILMNCTSAYPPKIGDVKLGFITTMQGLFPKAVIGHSDHTNSIYTSLGAIALGAKVIEKHVTVDKSLVGPDQEVSIDFNEFNQMVLGGRIISKSLSNEKKILDSEKEIVQWARRSIVYLKNKEVGEIIEAEDVWGKRPGTGVPSKFMNQVLGRKLKRSVKANTLLNLEDLD